MSEISYQCWICPQCHDDKNHTPGDDKCRWKQEENYRNLKAENEQLQAKVAELELEEEGAKKAFGVIVDKNKDLRSRNVELEKTIHRQVIEISRLYRSGARPMHDDAEKVGGEQ